MSKYLNYIIFSIKVLTLFSAQIAFGQSSSSAGKCTKYTDNLTKREIYQNVDLAPKFPEGDDSLISFLSHNLQWPPDEVDFAGIVYISFIIEIDGSLTSTKIVHGIYPAADKEALRVIKKMPKWLPGKCNGKVIPVEYVFPIKFMLE